MAEERILYLVRRDNAGEDFFVGERSPDGRLVGRIYKHTSAATGLWWFWAVQIFPAMAADSGNDDTREEAMARLKARWIDRYDAWNHWIGPQA